jgi:hypothetical protein
MHRFATLLVAVGVVLGIACIDTSAPPGAASISVLQLPSPSVVVGDTMRDSLGVAAPLTVVAYDGNNVKLTDIVPLFFISDTSHTAHLKGGTVLVGDKLGSVQLIGQVGGLQTPPVSVPVTVAPKKFAVRLPLPDTLHAHIAVDSASSIDTVSLGVTLVGGPDSAVQSFVVKYTLGHRPESKPGSTAVYLADDQGHIATADTTDASGGASRRLVVNSFFLTDQARTGSTVDSAVVVVSTSYKGVPVSGSITFVVRIRAFIPIK